MVEHSDPDFQTLVDKTIPCLPLLALKNCIRALNKSRPSQFPTIKLSGNKMDLCKRLQRYLKKVEQSPHAMTIITAKRIILTESERSTSRPSFNNSPMSHKTNLQNKLECGKTFDWSQLTFKSSPFYTIVEKLSSFKLCEVQQGLATITLDFQFRSHQIMQLRNKPGKDSQYRIMLFSTDVDLDHMEPNGLKERFIEFPPAVHLDINTKRFLGNLQGNKRKPGSTNPPDISDLCITRIGETNWIKCSYSATPKAYVIVVYLVKTTTVEEIMEKIKAHKRMGKATVLKKINRSSNDTDIEATSSLISLKCPLGYQRIQVPCRSSYCNHIQCFDGLTFLKLNERTPSWTCPICNRVFDNWNELVLDGYFEDILEKVDSDIDKVIVEVDGSWRLPDKEQAKEELIDIKREDIIIDASSDSEHDIHPTFKPRVTGVKRSSEVIDLTLSSDEETSVQPKRSCFESSRPKK